MFFLFYCYLKTIDSFSIPNGVANSLKGSLNQTSQILNDNNHSNDVSVCNKLKSFTNIVIASLDNGKLTQEQGEILEDQASAIMKEIGCF